MQMVIQSDFDLSILLHTLKSWPPIWIK